MIVEKLPTFTVQEKLPPPNEAGAVAVMTALPGELPVTWTPFDVPLMGNVKEPGTDATAGFEEETVNVVLVGCGGLILTVTRRISPVGMVADGHSIEIDTV